ncbi:palmitoyltransferase ZDHHC19 isoform X1 [Peromyscus eremicus]|uniref:palmitoyltransferase ZDHHC19 isoform X1 n=3 Tax=Peromyscus eremicus TaxID=42410 RepID=UPI0027DD2A97|nr:palmitoyltransferase ZDHHC19 isoform X1 [Peromyscus eremicus]
MDNQIVGVIRSPALAMPFPKEDMTRVKEPQQMPVVPRSWFLPSLFAAFNVMLLVFLSGLFFGFPCRWLAQNGEWVFPMVTGPLFILTFFSLVSLNFSDPGILHRGSVDEDPMMVYVVSVNQRAFRLQWCSKCCFHRPPRTYHCPWCNICVEDFDHHCKWVNNCIGHRNFRLFMVLVLSLCLYSGALLLTCLIFLIRTSHLPFSVDKIMAVLVAAPAAGFLIPLVLLLLIQAISVSTAERSCESKCRNHQEYNPFDQGFARNWYLTMCAPLSPKYMSEVVCLQRPVGTEWIYEKTQPSPPCPPEHCSPGPPGPSDPPDPPGPQPQPPTNRAGKGPRGSGEVIVLKEIDASPRLSLLSETPRRGSPRRTLSLDHLNLYFPI